jgi:hypothetical protein
MKEYHVTQKPVFKQKLPKKCVFNKKINVTPKYECRVGFWIPDTPYSKNPPGIALTFGHGAAESSQYVRVVFNDPRGLVDFFKKFEQFKNECFDKIVDQFNEALREWNGCRSKVAEYKAESVKDQLIS